MHSGPQDENKIAERRRSAEAPVGTAIHSRRKKLSTLEAKSLQYHFSF
jgi:hypothetical protein